MLFPAQVELLEKFMHQREAIVTRIDGVLNCQKKSLDYQQDQSLQAQLFKDCFNTLPGLSREQSLLGATLEQAHWASGFKPRAQPGNDIIDPVQMLLRGLHFWRQTRWPGQRGRVRYAQTLFNLHIIRSLALLTLRLWDETPAAASERLSCLQLLLDQLWRTAPADQPRLVRDIRWLLPVAMSPTTDSLAGYFDVALNIAEHFDEADRVETQKAWVQTGAGHLCSQLRHLSLRRNLGIDAPELVLLTRKSNALDVTLLMEGLVTLFDAYEQTLQRGDAELRRALAAAICQGISPDPELFLLSPQLLRPYTMIEHLFISVDAAGHAAYTAMGQRHLRLLDDYAAVLGRVAPSLYADVQQCRHPAADGYSPYGALYGFASNVLELLAFKTLLPEPAAPFSMEDAFTAGDADKRAWVNNWRHLPHIKPELVQQYEYSQPFVDAISERIERALQHCCENAAPAATVACGRLFVVPDAAAALQQIPALPLQYVHTSDPQLAAKGKAQLQDPDDLRHCRLEGEFLVSVATPTGWIALSKDLLTDITGRGLDVQLPHLPRTAVEVLRLMCPGLEVVGS